MANTINDLYLKYVNGVGSALEEDRYFQYLYEMIQAGDKSLLQQHRIMHKEVDERWLTTIEECLDPLNRIIEKPRRFVERIEEVVPVDLAKRITADSVRHLSMNTQFIASGKDSDEIYPTRILNVSNEDSYDLYENRFIYHLILRLVTFIDKRTDVIFWSTGDEHADVFRMESHVDDAYEQIDYKVEMTIKNQQNFMENDADQMNVFMRIDRVRRLVMALRNSPFCELMSGCQKVRSPIQRTNLLTKDPDYRKCYQLWQFLESYDEVGYTIDVKDTTLEYDEEYQIQMYTNMITNYTVFKSITEDENRNVDDETPRRYRKLRPHFVRQLQDEALDYDIRDAEVVPVVLEEVTEGQLAAEAKLAEETETCEQTMRDNAALERDLVAVNADLDEANKRADHFEAQYVEEKLVRQETEEALEEEKVLKEEALAAVEEGKQEMARQAKAHEDELTAAKAAAAEELASTKAAAAEELASAKAAAAEELASTKAAAAQELEETKEAAYTAYTQLQESKDAELASTKAAAEAELSAVKASAEAELTVVSEAAAQAALKAAKELADTRSAAAEELANTKAAAEEELASVKAVASEELAAVKASASEELASTKAAAEAELSTVKALAEAELTAAKDAAAAAYQQLVESKATELTALKQQSDSDLATAVKKAADDLAMANKKAADELASVNKKAAEVLAAANSEAADKQAEMQRAADKMAKQLAEAQAKTKELEDMILRLNEENARLSAERASLTKEKSKLSKEKTKIQDEKASLEQTKTKLESSLKEERKAHAKTASRVETETKLRHAIEARAGAESVTEFIRASYRERRERNKLNK